MKWNVNDGTSSIATLSLKRHTGSVIYLLILTVWLLLQSRLTSLQSSRMLLELGALGPPSSAAQADHDTDPIASLIALTRSHNEISCPSSLLPVYDTLLDPALALADGRKIPRIVHISSGSRCNDKIIADNLDTWRLKDHFFFLHDDQAVLNLLHQDWPEFPMLNHIAKCLPGKMGASWIDLWRLLVLWKYGGIYADFDTSPVPSRFNASTILPDDDAFFVVDATASPSQWFMAASPRHPMIYLSVFQLMINVMNQMNLGNFKIVFTTGPGAVMQGFAAFMRNQSLMWDSPEGHYIGVGNRTVTLVGNATNENMYITRVIEQLGDNVVKNDIYKKTNMTHLTEETGTVYNPNPNVDESCLSRLFTLEHQRFMSTAKSALVNKEI